MKLIVLSIIFLLLAFSEVNAQNEKSEPFDAIKFDDLKIKGIGLDSLNSDVIRIFGSDAGMVLFAELLLNLSLPHNEQDEFELEGESGFRGVGISSAEVRLFLPNGLFWTEEHWQES